MTQPTEAEFFSPTRLAASSADKSLQNNNIEPFKNFHFQKFLICSMFVALQNDR